MFVQTVYVPLCKNKREDVSMCVVVYAGIPFLAIVTMLLGGGPGPDSCPLESRFCRSCKGS